ncbi:MAG: 16S rRNA (guanine(966)-N(2))-methyltransferase RsmD [Sedimentisphaerales bacterium]|nr:16S rRNA (guanine(966)-N(2))-methyltransferase RsmD [Sedimentisphaerales bacterium]
MRIIAGTKKGMNLFGPKSMVSRPITDRVKESLFSVLYKYDLPEGAILADLFSGVGSMGLESLSRGAKFVTFVDRDWNIVKILKQNIEKAGFVEQSHVLKTSAFNVELEIAPEGEKCDLVFVDPPYVKSKKNEYGSPLAKLLISLGDKITSEGVVVVRTSDDVEIEDNYGQLQVVERRKWGTMNICFLRGEES